MYVIRRAPTPICDRSSRSRQLLSGGARVGHRAIKPQPKHFEAGAGDRRRCGVAYGRANASADQRVLLLRAAGQGRAGGLRLGHNSSISAGNLRATIIGWRQAEPDVDVDCVETNRSVLLAGLDTGEVDIAVLMGAVRYNGYQNETFWSERMFVALPAANPLSHRELVHWTDLRNERFGLSAADPGPVLRDLLLGRLAVSDARPEIRIHQCSRETILSVLGGRDHVTLVCEGSTGMRYPDVVYRPIQGEQGPALIGYSGYWSAANRNPALRRFLQFIKARHALSFDFSERFQ